MRAIFQVQKIHLLRNLKNLPLYSCKRPLPTSVYKLVDLKYVFVGQSFKLEIRHRCCHHKYDFIKENSTQNTDFCSMKVENVDNNEIFSMIVKFRFSFEI